MCAGLAAIFSCHWCVFLLAGPDYGEKLNMSHGIEVTLSHGIEALTN
jgi:hypothetical protein